MSKNEPYDDTHDFMRLLAASDSGVQTNRQKESARHELHPYSSHPYKTLNSPYRDLPMIAAQRTMIPYPYKRSVVPTIAPSRCSAIPATVPMRCSMLPATVPVRYSLPTVNRVVHVVGPKSNSSLRIPAFHTSYGKGCTECTCHCART